MLKPNRETEQTLMQFGFLARGKTRRISSIVIENADKGFPCLIVRNHQNLSEN